ncbi:MAG: hypothetical protein PQJ49_02345 [Sphaerochaetaceae bacterium]|nr:hypothetical protein [Sphaerochaetaceae bacterium]MDC7237109.1 hypothetical protein [Sphaerochaetaceae bacterium]MDC7248740.1 hypothetical protein [Sphaerochaetaceae bacterium]
MTIKILHIFTISTLISYSLLIIVASDIGIIHYQDFKSNIIAEKKENLLLEAEIESLIIEKEQLESQEQVLDLAFELGYVNTGDKILYKENNSDKQISKNYKPINYSNKKSKNLLFSGWKNYQFFLLALPIGIAITLCYLLISKKMERKND